MAATGCRFWCFWLRSHCRRRHCPLLCYGLLSRGKSPKLMNDKYFWFVSNTLLDHRIRFGQRCLFQKQLLGGCSVCSHSMDQYHGITKSTYYDFCSLLRPSTHSCSVAQVGEESKSCNSGVIQRDCSSTANLPWGLTLSIEVRRQEINLHYTRIYISPK